MATPGEMTQDMNRVLDALNQARQFVEAHDHADSVRSKKVHRSALRTALELAEKAGERVAEFLGNQEPTGPLNTRDGGPL